MHQQWYDAAWTIAISFPDSEQREAALVMVDHASRVLLKREPARSQALAWFQGETTLGMPLDEVCEILHLNPYDIRRRLRYMEEHPYEDAQKGANNV
jgi:hypothetical protein